MINFKTKNKEKEDLKKKENDLILSTKEIEIGKNELRDELVKILNDNVQKEKQFTKSKSFRLIQL